ncbi:MAG: 2-phosphosulfolactate phosphatase [Nitrospinota bacterium]
MRCEVAFSHREVPLRSEDLAEGKRGEIRAVVIDVLRATTTVVAALAAGCEALYPLREVEEARELAARLREAHGKDRVLLGGEKGGRPIPGFDLGNSPREYTPGRVEGRHVVLTTTNGTQTIAAASGVGAGEVLLASFANLRAAACHLARGEGPFLIACSGRKGGYSEEDAVAAGLLVEAAAGSSPLELGDSGRAALAVARAYEGDLGHLLRTCQWGRYLAGLGLEEDLAFCARRDWTEVVPTLKEGAIRPS